jgi:hypothetical protein
VISALFFWQAFLTSVDLAKFQIPHLLPNFLAAVKKFMMQL